MPVRAATAADAPAIADLAERTFALACPPGVPQEAIDIHIAQELSEQRFARDIADNQLFVADEDGIVGYVMNVVGAPPIEVDWVDPVEVRRIYVDEHLHGGGVADELMAAGLDAAAGGGHDWIWLGTNRENERALRFYRKHGFQIVGEKSFELGGTVQSDFVLARRVPTVEA